MTLLMSVKGRNREKELLANPQYVNEYAQDILGNTEVELELNGRAASSPRPRNNNLAVTENLNMSMNSPRPNNETSVPQNEVTSIVNASNNFRLNRMQLNTEGVDSYYADPLNDNYNSNGLFERLSTERGNEFLNSALLLNNSNANLLNQSLEKKHVDPKVRIILNYNVFVFLILILYS